MKDDENGKWKAEYDFGDKVDLGTVEPYWTDPKTGAQLCEVGSSHVLRERDGEGWKQTFRIGRLMCQKPITREYAIQLVSDGKTEIIKGFISKKGRPFDALLETRRCEVHVGIPAARTESSTRTASPIARKAKAPPDLSKGTVSARASCTRTAKSLEAGDRITCAVPIRITESCSR